MRLNIFKIPEDQLAALAKKLADKNLETIKTVELDGWSGRFMFCESPDPGHIPWINTFAAYFDSLEYFNCSYFAVMMMRKAELTYALTFGKSHFYVRPHCDYDFGIELSKRIADENDIAMTSARRFQGKQKKDIRSFTGHARLSIPPGESVDFLQSAVVSSLTSTYGSTGKFGASVLLNPDIEPTELGSFLTKLEADLNEPEKFKLPRTIVLSDADDVQRYDEKLLDELIAPIGASDIATDSFDLFGVDFVFGSSGSFKLKCGHYGSVDLERLTMRDVKEYILDRKIPREKLLNLKITHSREGDTEFTQSIKESVDFICDEDRVVLSGGKWLKFNQDYLDYLDDSVRQNEVLETETEFKEIVDIEADFNQRLSDHGYKVADRDFSVLKTRSSTPIEAWDLSKQETVYAVKFGTPQKLNYVCDQAINVLELLHNRASVSEIPNFARYCLWLGYRAKKQPVNLADSGSIILKQKVDAWARRCEELGIRPALKLSLKLHVDHDKPGAEKD